MFCKAVVGTTAYTGAHSTIMGTQTLETPVRVQQPLPQYHVIVYNCDCHTFGEVIVAFVRILGMGVHDAQQKAIEIDQTGRAIVATTNKEVAELYAERINAETNNGRHGLRTQIVPAN